MLQYHRENTINQEEITSWAGGVALKLSSREAPRVHAFLRRASEFNSINQVNGWMRQRIRTRMRERLEKNKGVLYDLLHKNGNTGKVDRIETL